MKRSPRIATFLAAVAIIALTIMAWPRVARFVAVDDCLDRGGSYDHANDVCDLVRSHPGPGRR